MKYICPKYPSLSFYVGNVMYRFEAGIFDSSSYSELEQLKIKEALAKTDPSTGVMAEEEYDLPFKCSICERKFASQSGLNGHKPAHKTQADINALSWREGGSPKNES